MRDHVKIHISQALLERAATTLEAVAAHRRDLIAKTSEIIGGEAASNWDDQSALDAVRTLERDAHEMRLCLSYLPEKATEKDQLSVIEELRAELEKEGLRRNMRYGTPADDIRSMFREAMSQRKEAFDAWASLVDDQRVNLRAIKLMAESALQQSTHRRKDSRLYVLIDIMQNMLVELLEIDVDEPDMFHHWSSRDNASWEVRKVLAKNRQLEQRIKHLVAAAEVAEAKVAKNGGQTDDNDGANDDDEDIPL